MKKRKFLSHSSHAELYDANEQELAKDGECPDRGTHRSGTDTSCESVPDIIVDNKAGDSAARVMLDAPREENTGGKEHFIPSPPPHRDKTPHGILARVYGAVIVLCIIASIAMVFFSADMSEAPPTQGADSDGTEQSPTSESTDTQSPDTSLSVAESVYQRGIKSTVSVISTQNGEKRVYTGFAVFDGTYIATLCEAVSGESVKIVTCDGRAFPAELVASDASVNLALLKCPAPDLEPLGIEQSAAVTLGESIFAIANLGSEQYASSLLAGEISYIGRQCTLSFPDGIDRKANTIQLSSIAPDGVGGCPVFNREGSLVAMMLPTSSEASATFAYSIADVYEVLGHLKDGGAVPSDSLYALAYAPSRLGILGESTLTDGIWGVSVKGFSDDSSDAASTLYIGDLIYKANTTLITGTDSLSAFLDSHACGEVVEIFVLRGTQRMSFYVTLA